MYRATSDNQHNTYMHWVTTQNSNFLGKLTPIKLSDQNQYGQFVAEMAKNWNRVKPQKENNK